MYVLPSAWTSVPLSSCAASRESSAGFALSGLTLPSGLSRWWSCMLDPAELQNRPRVQDEQFRELVAGGALGPLFMANAALAGERKERGGELV